ncbi:MAG TPA: hypothetical protein VNZ86_12355 [Bacteroidia bacterium]|jgi:hypothetical protein|nr:hypothetical protein [Bacteroidia bacterium]
MKATKKTEEQQKAHSISFQNGIISWRLEEGCWYTPDQVSEEMAKHEILAGTKSFALLVDASNNAVMDLECTERIICQGSVHRKAVAILTGENLASRLMLNFYVQKCESKGAVRMFKSEAIALSWLQEQLHKDSLG